MFVGLYRWMMMDKVQKDADLLMMGQSFFFANGKSAVLNDLFFDLDFVW